MSFIFYFKISYTKLAFSKDEFTFFYIEIVFLLKQVHFYTELICSKDEFYLKFKSVVVLELFFMLCYFKKY